MRSLPRERGREVRARASEVNAWLHKKTMKRSTRVEKDKNTKSLTRKALVFYFEHLEKRRAHTLFFFLFLTASYLNYFTTTLLYYYYYYYYYCCAHVNVRRNEMNLLFFNRLSLDINRPCRFLHRTSNSCSKLYTSTIQG